MNCHYSVTTEINGRRISTTPLQDPFVFHIVRVSWRDLIRSIFAGGLVLKVMVSGHPVLMDVVLRVSQRFSPPSVVSPSEPVHYVGPLPAPPWERRALDAAARRPEIENPTFEQASQWADEDEGIVSRIGKFLQSETPAPMPDKIDVYEDESPWRDLHHELPAEPQPFPNEIHMEEPDK